MFLRYYQVLLVIVAHREGGLSSLVARTPTQSSQATDSPDADGGGDVEWLVKLLPTRKETSYLGYEKDEVLDQHELDGLADSLAGSFGLVNGGHLDPFPGVYTLLYKDGRQPEGPGLRDGHQPEGPGLRESMLIAVYPPVSTVIQP